MNSRIEQILKKKSKRGFLLIVLLCITMVASIVAFILAAIRAAKPKIGVAPGLYLFGRLPLGSNVFWGVILMSLSGLMIVAFVFSDAMASPDYRFLFLCIVPPFLTGMLILVYKSRYTKYICAVDQLLDSIAEGKSVFEAHRFSYTYKNGVQRMSAKGFYDMLFDMRQNSIIRFTKESSSYLVTMFDVATPSKSMQNAQQVPVEPWVCIGCGASNTEAQCEYCGNSRN